MSLASWRRILSCSFVCTTLFCVSRWSSPLMGMGPPAVVPVPMVNIWTNDSLARVVIS